MADSGGDLKRGELVGVTSIWIWMHILIGNPAICGFRQRRALMRKVHCQFPAVNHNSGTRNPHCGCLENSNCLWNYYGQGLWPLTPIVTYPHAKTLSSSVVITITGMSLVLALQWMYCCLKRVAKSTQLVRSYLLI